MAITRRQFVTRLGALAAALGMSQADLSKVTEAFAHGGAWAGGNWTKKPKVIWVHGAECTGDSTSLLSLFEDVRAPAIEGLNVSTLAALDVVAGGSGDGTQVTRNPYLVNGVADPHPFGHRTVVNSATVTGCDFDKVANSTGSANDGAYIANIADVLIDFLDLQYHETVMGMGGDQAFQWLFDNMASGSHDPFVLVVEGSVQDSANNGYWNKTGPISWCSIGADGTNDGTHDGWGWVNDFDVVVASLATQANCAAVVAIGQCASFGGYPACISPVLKVDGTDLNVQSGHTKGSMTDAKGVYDFLNQYAGSAHVTADAAHAAANKVVNVPGCPTNPWWFVLTVVAWLVDFATIGASPNSTGMLGVLARDGSGNLGFNGAAVDSSRRLKAVYGTPIHGPACPRYQDYLNGTFAAQPGDSGCLQLIGCKGPSTNSLCAVHGWNSMQPHNDATWEHGVASMVNGGRSGSFCVASGHPCMGCAEQGYPDKVVPFVVR